MFRYQEEKKSFDEVARTEAYRNAASVFESENSNWLITLCAEQFTCEIRTRRDRSIPTVFAEVGDLNDGINQL